MGWLRNRPQPDAPPPTDPGGSDAVLVAQARQGDARAFANARVTLTELGREVLAGETDRLAVAPIDRWLGGMHLRGDPDWRWDRTAGALRV